MAIFFVLSAQYHYWVIDGITIFVLTTLLIISWYKKLWIMYASDAEQSLPQSKISLLFYRMSDCMQRSITIRLVVYFLVILSYGGVATMQVVGKIYMYNNFCTI